jgi:DNA-binding NarL/FixJ family response regulator
MTTDPNDLLQRDLQQRAIESAAKAKQAGTAAPASRPSSPRAPVNQSAPIAGDGVTDTAELMRLVQMLRSAEAATPATETLIVIGEFSVPATRIPDTYIAQLQTITRAEAAVLRLLGWGRANTDIAMLLDSTEATVRTHMNNVVKRLNVDGMRELITLAGLLFHPLD